MRIVSSLGFVTFAALAFATPASAADFSAAPEAPPPAAYGPPPAPVYAAPIVVAPGPYYRPYPYRGWRGYWGPRYAGWYGRPGWRRW